MNHSGDAAEQIVRMSLEGVEVAAKITGNAAREIAMFLIAALKSPEKNSGALKLKGKARMASMLKSGKALEIYSVKESDLKKFYQGAKQYGIVYCVLRNSKSSPDGLCDILVKAEDAPKISRMAERFKFATVDKAKIESEIVAEKAGKSADRAAEGVEPEAPNANDAEELVNDLLGTMEDQGEPEKTEQESDTVKSEPEKEQANEHPLDSKPPRNDPSEPTFGSNSKSEKVSSDKPSVKEEIRKIRLAQKKQADTPVRDDQPDNQSKTASKTTIHKRPQGGKKAKSKKMKERT